jgi:hypothetical protein
VHLITIFAGAMIHDVLALLDEEAVRAVALAWLHRVTLGGMVRMRRGPVAHDFHVAVERSPLIYPEAA